MSPRDADPERAARAEAGKPDRLMADVTVRAWEPNLKQEGARFKATVVRELITLHVADGDPLAPNQRTIALDGITVIAPSAYPNGQNAVDVVVRAVPDRPKFTILRTPELIWVPINAHRDPLANWRIECIPFTEWIRIRLGANEAEVKASQDGR